MAYSTTSTSTYLYRTASLPAPNTFTACGWCYCTSSVSFNALFTLISGSSDERLIQFGSSLAVFGIYDGSTTTNFASSPGGGVWFFWALSCTSGTNNFKGYWSLASSNTFVTVSATPAAAGTIDTMRLSNDVANEYLNGNAAHIKIWDAVLTQAEIEQEKWSVRPQRIANLHLWSPLFKDDFDYSGNGKNWTSGGADTFVDGPPVGWGAQPYMVGAVGAAAAHTPGSIYSSISL